MGRTTTGRTRSAQDGRIDTAHYPWVTRLLLSLQDEGEFANVAAIEVEPRYGYVGRIVYRNGAVRMFIGRGVEGLNNTAASRVARDKGWTRHFLQVLGYRCPRGEKFVLADFADTLDRRLGRQFAGYLLEDEALPYVEANLGYPVYVKVANGSGGVGVYRCFGPSEVADAIEEFRAGHAEAFVVEEDIRLPDYRAVVFDDEVISCYERRPLSVVGDGRSTVAELIALLQERFDEQGRDKPIETGDLRLSRNLARFGLTIDHVLPAGLEQQLLEVSNLSAGGRAVDRLEQIHERWKRLCVDVSQDFGLHVCGVDLACADIGDPTADYSILELNSSPGLDNYAAEGSAQEAAVRDLYRRVFDDPRGLPVRAGLAGAPAFPTSTEPTDGEA